MNLTTKDAEFLEKLRPLLESNDLWVEVKAGSPSYMVLRGTYGDKIHKAFGMTRQGVRWRFQRVFSQIYVSGFETILSIERVFGPQLREHAIRISRERHVLRQEVLNRSLKPDVPETRSRGTNLRPPTTDRRGPMEEPTSSQ